jgi:hypothetical protein
MAIFSSVISWLIKKRIHQIELFKKYPIEVQEEMISRFISTAENTEWGKKYQYHKFSNINDFRKHVPLNSYEDLEPYIMRLRQGESNILWPEEIKWFAKSSGTTSSKSKFIPISQSSLEDCHYKAGKDLISIYFNLYPESKLFEGKSLIMGGSRQIQEVSNASYYEGDLSAILMQNLPFWAEFMRTPSLKVALMDEWEQKLELMVEETINHDVRSISGVPSWMLVLLKRILERTKKENIMEVWPNLEVFFHGGVNFEPYRKQYNEIIRSDKMVYLETYNASEGFFGIQDQRDSKELLLMLDYGIFYEFIPVENLNDPQPETLLLQDVEVGKNYAMVITTNGGLWRYIIGDTVTFTSVFPFRIRITGRTKLFINIVGEEVIIENAEKAFAMASEESGAIIGEFTGAPRFRNEKGEDETAHEWLIEFEKEPDDLDRFKKLFDEYLKSVNSDYEAKRYNDLVLKPPVIKKIPKGTFYHWMKKRNKLGGQNKVPRLANNREIIEDVLKMIDNQ